MWYWIHPMTQMFPPSKGYANIQDNKRKRSTVNVIINSSHDTDVSTPSDECPNISGNIRKRSIINLVMDSSYDTDGSIPSDEYQNIQGNKRKRSIIELILDPYIDAADSTLSGDYRELPDGQQRKKSIVMLELSDNSDSGPSIGDVLSHLLQDSSNLNLSDIPVVRRRSITKNIALDSSSTVSDDQSTFPSRQRKVGGVHLVIDPSISSSDYSVSESCQNNPDKERRGSSTKLEIDSRLLTPNATLVDDNPSGTFNQKSNNVVNLVINSPQDGQNVLSKDPVNRREISITNLVMQSSESSLNAPLPVKHTHSTNNYSSGGTFITPTQTFHLQQSWKSNQQSWKSN